MWPDFTFYFSFFSFQISLKVFSSSSSKQKEPKHRRLVSIRKTATFVLLSSQHETKSLPIKNVAIFGAVVVFKSEMEPMAFNFFVNNRVLIEAMNHPRTSTNAALKRKVSASFSGLSVSGLLPEKVTFPPKKSLGEFQLSFSRWFPPCLERMFSDNQTVWMSEVQFLKYNWFIKQDPLD